MKYFLLFFFLPESMWIRDKATNQILLTFQETTYFKELMKYNIIIKYQTKITNFENHESQQVPFLE